MNLLEKFDKLNNRLTNLLEENKELKQQYKDIHEENQELKARLEKHYENLREENKELKEKLVQFQNLTKQKSDRLEVISRENKELKQQYKNLQGENRGLEEKINERDKHILNLERKKNKKNEQLELISQNLEKTLAKFGLDEVDNNDNDIISQNFEEHLRNPFNESWRSCIRAIVGLNFGTIYSGFTYCHVLAPKEIITNNVWPGEIGNLKTNTVLQYDSSLTNVEQWGRPALCRRSNRRNKSKSLLVELFKLHLGNLPDNLKPRLPNGLDYKKAITDFLREIGKLIQEQLVTRWSNIDFLNNVLLVLTVPAEYSSRETAIMRDCVYNAGLIEDRHSNKLQFTTEPEATAIYCTKSLQDYDSHIGTTFMVVDCSGDTVDLTTHKLIGNNKLSEIIKRVGDLCGSTYIDREFVNFLRRKVGTNSIDLFKENHYSSFQYLIKEFCRFAKFIFTGDNMRSCYEIDITNTAPGLSQYFSKEVEEIMENNEYTIEIKYDDIKSMFDPVVNRIIRLIQSQLDSAQETYSTIFLVGGFSESEYLQRRIKQEFQNTINVFTPANPAVANSRGAVMYGLIYLRR